jgi:beta-lactamase class D
VVTAVSHNVEKVLDPSYAPTDPSEKSLFEEQKKFVYSALEHTLQTDMGKNLVREHSFDFNAQEVFRKVVKQYTESASAKIGSSNTLAYLTTAKYGTSWTGTRKGSVTVHYLATCPSDVCHLVWKTQV